MISRVQSEEDMEAAWAVRKEVFVDEQNVPIEEEIDDLDQAPTTIHLLARDDEGPAGTGRILLDTAGYVHLGRICIVARVRGTGLGRELMAELEKAAYDAYADNGRLTIELSAQRGAQGFYESLGYDYVSHREYLDAGIWHKDMRKTIGG
ncbi:GNAT family N-acetyltransferase [Flaviflexus huanghaiensis]|uniref:GNAT family N-acetyltransferase n=1 Tax=Flaviflexus huanghaiensis TaxID=1111473 RepID=UPI0019D63668